MEKSNFIPDMPKSINILRSTVRPVITYLLVLALFAACMLAFIQTDMSKEKSELLMTIIDVLFKLNLVSLGFWYSSRLLTRTGLLDVFKKNKQLDESATKK